MHRELLNWDQPNLEPSKRCNHGMEAGGTAPCIPIRNLASWKRNWLTFTNLNQNENTIYKRYHHSPIAFSFTCFLGDLTVGNDFVSIVIF